MKFIQLLCINLVLFTICAINLMGQQGSPSPNRFYGQITHIDTTQVHDPVIIKQDSIYYLFTTGWGINVHSSEDMVMWKREKAVFQNPPQWAVDTIPNFRGHIWAPDIILLNGVYHIYYSVSAFGKNTSAIGVATNKTLHPNSPNYQWIDHGPVIHSTPGVTNWNAIDANIIIDKKGNPWMSFGSFWDGIKLIKLNRDGLSVAENPLTIPTIASRKSNPNSSTNPPAVDNNPVDAGGNAIEAPFIFKHGKYYYLFVSLDYCCKGLESTYKIAVGRSKRIEGPYIDKDGVLLSNRGGTTIRLADNKFAGIGHNAVFNTNGKTYLVAHGYSREKNGKSVLLIEQIIWENGWPKIIQAQD